MKKVLALVDGRAKYLLYYTAKALRKHLSKPRFTHAAQAKVLCYFGNHSTVAFDAPILLGFVRRWSLMTRSEQNSLILWMRSYMPYHEGWVCFRETGLYYYAIHTSRFVRVKQLLAPYPRELWAVGRG
jgi:hypothetical protein